jgi:hypothetical protein
VPDFTKEVTIIINEDDPQTTDKFTVLEGMLAEHSGFFQATCRDASGEDATVIKLPQVDPDIFRAYLFWIHRNKIAFNTDFASQSVSGSDLYPTSLGLAMLWLLADRLTTSKLRDDVMEALHRVLASLDHTQGSPTDVLPPSITALVWSATTTDRSLRGLVVEYYATKVPIPVIEQRFEEYHPDFVQELMQKIIEIHQSTEADATTPQVSGDHQHAHQDTETNLTPQANGDHHHDHQNTETTLPTPPVNGDHHQGAPNQPPRPLNPAAQRTNAPAARTSARIILQDSIGNILHAQSALFFTPDRFVGAILPKLQDQATGGDEQASIEVTLQFPNNASQPVGRSEWSKSFGQVSTHQILVFDQ